MIEIFKIILKILKTLPMVLAGLFGIVQVLLKGIKEALTVIVDVLYPVIPIAKFQNIVDSIRNFVNWFDGIVEKIKSKLLELGILQ